MGEIFDINDTAKIPVGIAKLDGQTDLPAVDVPEIIIITGMSGAGRTRAGATLEDLGWYVIDNLPPRLLPAMAGLVTAQSGVKKLACVVDVRTREFFQELMGILKELDDNNTNYRILFLDASNEELVRRYESVRRPHPLQGGGRLLDGIMYERNVIEGLRLRSDVVIDTTTMSIHDLARKVRNLVTADGEARVHLTVMSFGFKYGLPVDADHVADVRFLPNPYWVTELRHLTGKDEPVRDFVLSIDGAQAFANQYVDLLSRIVNGYERELKPYVTIAIGCTGGKHRSVAMAEEIATQFGTLGLPVRTIHRDLGRE
ncbi:RNase adapter RapZ [Arcanobacterium ihumii]|uniref:RNase adapter RapZ n=1 Tax=Arcanobacterium ihumii TaxID=2138162 RepID=UPI000F542FC7|nr:RNase adapter RapZ [Arcanobacterium ihumii]